MALFKRLFQSILLTVILLSIPLRAGGLSLGIIAGYNGGTNVQFSGEIAPFAKGFPFGVQVSIARISLNPGIPLDARKIFINDATNGDPEKFGNIWDFRFDFPYQIKKFKKTNTSIFLGPRYSMFTGRFNFIGGNEDFDVRTNMWGAGAGIKSQFEITEHLDLVISGGADYYQKSSIYAHGTTYSPDGEHIDSRKDFEYKDANAAINQPLYKFHTLIGFQYRF